MNEFFVPRRFLYTVKREELMRWKSLVTTALTIAGVSALVLLLTGGGVESRRSLFTGFLFIGGFLNAAAAFNSMHTAKTAHDWLMLPASTEEKFVSRLAVSSIGYWLFISAVFFTGTLAAEALRLLIAGRMAALFNPFEMELLGLLPHYIILQSVFIAGGAFFSKHQFIKTVLFLSLLGLFLFTVGIIGARFIFSDYVHGAVHFNFSRGFTGFFPDHIRSSGQIVITLIKVIYFGLLAPFCWLIAYLRVREAEVRHAL